MPNHDIIVIGASAGGVEALSALVRGLPADLPAALFIVLHVPAQSPSFLPTILSRSGPLPAEHATHGATIELGHIYVAPPDHHLLIEHGHMLIVRGPKENRHRPAVDPLFRSAARAYGARVTGVILTGALDDGTAGLLAVKRRGGIAVVQDPQDALYPGMPGSALASVEIDYCLPLGEIAPALVRLVHEPASGERVYAIPEEMEKETKMAEMDMAELSADNHAGTPSAFSCPECGGVLWELQDSALLRFRCRVGHAFTVESVIAEQSVALEEALWSALNTLEERASLSRRLIRQARNRGQDWMAERFEGKLREDRQHADVIRQVLMKTEQVISANNVMETPAATTR